MVRSRFSFIFSCFSCSLGVVCGYHHLDATCGCRRFGAVFVCLHRGATFICVITIQASKIYSISDNKSN